MILVIDNYDSFTYNLVQYLGELGADAARSRATTRSTWTTCVAHGARAASSSRPGPAIPTRRGVSLDVIRRLGPTTPILGVCLGHQAIGQAFGGTVARARRQMHGKTSRDPPRRARRLRRAPEPVRGHALPLAGRAARTRVPADLEITARAEDGEIMGLRHRRYPVEGVQFHPESILTVEGKRTARELPRRRRSPRRWTSAPSSERPR